MGERCNRCGGELAPGEGVVALLACKSCGREIPAAALTSTGRRCAVEPIRFFHQEKGGNTVLVACEHGLELHTRTSEIRLSYEALEWLLITGGPAALHARRRHEASVTATVVAG